MLALVVTHPFGSHKVGHRITDAATVKTILAGEHRMRVVKITVPDETTRLPPVPDPAKTAS